MNTPTDRTISRRAVLSSAMAGCAGVVAAPLVITAGKTEKPTVVGQGKHRYEVQHGWARLPDKYQWQTTHNVAVDRQGLLYVIHEGRANLTDHPSIFVFDPQGKFVRAFGAQFQGGGHGIEVRQEGGEEFLYVCAYQQLKTFAKLDLQGKVIWQKYAPMDSGVYAAGEDTKPQKIWGRDRFMPTNFAFLDDGGFLLADGYGSFYIHRYDKHGEWQSCFGGPGSGKGKFATPHGVWIDRRAGGDPVVVVTDRAHHTVQFLSLDGQHLHTVTGFGLPANADTRGNLMVIPELFGRVALLDQNKQIVATLGDDAQRVRGDQKFAIRGDQKQWRNGKFVHPHDACFGNDGSIFVAEWVATGRVTRLKPVS